MGKTILKKKKIINLLKKGIMITIGATIMAVGLEGILIPNNIIDGGVTGLSMILAHITPINLGVYLFILNLPFFYIGYKQISKKFAFSMLYGIIILSIITACVSEMKPIINNSLLALVFGGLMLGVGVGLVIRNGGVLDGTETLAILLEKKLPFSLGEIIMFVNIIIFSFASLVFGIENAMYSMITYFIAFKTIDIVVKGLDDTKAMYIISDYDEDIANAIEEETGRGITYLKGKGSHSGEEKKVILCIFTRLEEAHMKEIIREIDKDAFVIISDVSEVKGGSFSKKNVH